MDTPECPYCGRRLYTHLEFRHKMCTDCYRYLKLAEIYALMGNRKTNKWYKAVAGRR